MSENEIEQCHRWRARRISVPDAIRVCCWVNTLRNNDLLLDIVNDHYQTFVIRLFESFRSQAALSRNNILTTKIAYNCIWTESMSSVCSFCIDEYNNFSSNTRSRTVWRDLVHLPYNHDREKQALACAKSFIEMLIDRVSHSWKSIFSQ